MGATGWKFIVPYQEDMGRVLEDPKQEVFLRGDYEKPSLDRDFLEECEFFEADTAAQEAMLDRFGLDLLRRPLHEKGSEGLRVWLASLDDAPVVQTREDLDVLLSLSASGSFSILDIDRVTVASEGQSLSPLPVELLRQFFGMEQPTREQVELWQMRIPPTLLTRRPKIGKMLLP